MSQVPECSSLYIEYVSEKSWINFGMFCLKDLGGKGWEKRAKKSIRNERYLIFENWTLLLLEFGELGKGQNDYTEFWKQSLWLTIISKRLLSVHFLYNCCFELVLATFSGTIFQLLLEPNIHTFHVFRLSIFLSSGNHKKTQQTKTNSSVFWMCYVERET